MTEKYITYWRVGWGDDHCVHEQFTMPTKNELCEIYNFHTGRIVVGCGNCVAMFQNGDTIGIRLEIETEEFIETLRAKRATCSK